ncbi:MAG: hypothetical protein FWE13_04690 [Firmicutes bacterium]|nr:hypothetical protein [Bacillota bacterium]
MKLIKIEVTDELYNKISQNAKKQHLTDEKFIEQVLARFVLEPHIMEGEAVENGYIECGAINIEIANL